MNILWYFKSELTTANALNVKRILTTTIRWSITLVISGGSSGNNSGSDDGGNANHKCRNDASNWPGPICSLCAISSKIKVFNAYVLKF